MKKVLIMLAAVLMLVSCNMTAFAAVPQDTVSPMWNGSANVSAYLYVNTAGTAGTATIIVDGERTVMAAGLNMILYRMDANGNWVDMNVDWGYYYESGNYHVISETFDAAPNTSYKLVIDGYIATTTVCEPIYVEVYS